MKISHIEDPKTIMKDIKLNKREKYVLNSTALESLLFLLLQFYNVLSVSEIFKEENK
jgi:hypothetical protein